MRKTAGSRLGDGRDGEYERAYRCGHYQNHIGLFIFDFELPLSFLFALCEVVVPDFGHCFLMLRNWLTTVSGQYR